MLRWAGFYLDRPASASREQQSLALERTEQKPPLTGCEAKPSIGYIDDLLRLFQQQLHLRVGEDRLAVLRTRQVADFLPDCHQTQVVLARTPRHVSQECTAGGVRQEIG